ncbi:MAG: MATE family efflux transporter [Bacteroidaceae bacterium]|nr:MATE family efflux transporter [Bacteroidaceae bacterium]
MFSKAKEQKLLEMIRLGQEMSRKEKFNLIIRLSVPSILAQLTSTLMFFIDAAMVGKLGAEASAAIGIVETSTWLMFGLSSALAMGFSVQAAQFIGANDLKQAKNVYRQGILCISLVSVLLMLACFVITPNLPYWLGGKEDIASDASWYFGICAACLPLMMIGRLSSSMLKCTGNIRIPSIISIITCVNDVIFNYIFIYIFHLGVIGAAIGSGVAYAIACIAETWYAGVYSKEIRFKGEKWSLRPEWGYLKNAAKISLPMAAQYILIDGAQIVSTTIVAPLGTIAIAANTLAITAESLCYMPGYGISEAATTVVGQSVGAGRNKLCMSFARISLALGMTIMAVMGVIMFLTAVPLMSLLTPDKGIIQLGAECLRIEAFAEPFFAAAIVGNAILLGAGDTVKPAIISLCSMWFVRLALAASLAPRFGLNGVWIGMAIELTVRGSIFLLRVFKGNWIKKL